MPENDDGTTPNPAANLDDWIRRGPNIAGPPFGSVPGGPPPAMQCFPPRTYSRAEVTKARRTGFLLGLLAGAAVTAVVFVVVLLLL